MTYDEYKVVMADSQQARGQLDQQRETHPELFPAAMSEGYKLNGWTELSQKMPEVKLRRIRLLADNEAGQKLAYTIAPCDLLPYMSGMVSDVEKALFLKQFGVPDWGLTYVFGRNDSYWYRQTAAFGRFNLEGGSHSACPRLHASECQHRWLGSDGQSVADALPYCDPLALFLTRLH